MKSLFPHFFYGLLLSAMLLILAFASQQLTLEAKRDQLMEKRYAASLVALREQNDAKTISLLKLMARDFVAEMQRLKPAYAQWYKSLSLQERMQLMQGLEHKKWVVLMQEIQLDPQIFDRFTQNPELKRQYEAIQFQCDKAAEVDL